MPLPGATRAAAVDATSLIQQPLSDRLAGRASASLMLPVGPMLPASVIPGTLGPAGLAAHPPAVEAPGESPPGGCRGSPGSSPSGGMPGSPDRSMVALHGREGIMPDKLMRLRRNDAAADTRRPVMLAIAGDSAAGKTTLTRGIAEALGPDRA